jgi:UDP-N-acetylmuramoyl-L-alanyl-D-glutamate--2,6-diaminopimelate ligase
MVNLHTLFPDCTQDITITGLTVDSRAVKPGNLFAALPGNHVDGRNYIAQAIEAGAVAVLVPTGTSGLDAYPDIFFIQDDNPRLRFAKAAAAFYDQQPDLCAAVTGTNGKSSVVTFTRQLWSLLGHRAASVGTLGVNAPGLDISGGLTTPDPAGLHERLAEISRLGVTHLAMEASRHGLDQYRMDGVHVQLAAFTNLSRDHLDYHTDMADYLRAKQRLFSDLLKPAGIAVLNADIASYQTLRHPLDKSGHLVMTYGKAGQNIKLIEAQPTPHGQNLVLRVDGQNYKIPLKLAGYFQAENVMCAAAIVMASGHKGEDVMALLDKLDGVPGRMEAMGNGVYVDYAHTPDALETVLRALRPHTDGQLSVLFGCGGDRDKGKRPQMGEIAARFADRVYISDDNPRSEDAGVIRSEIMHACPNATEIGDRKRAIETAIADMKTGDVLLLAGKGHETGQIVGDQILPFDDRALARKLIHD